MSLIRTLVHSAFDGALPPLLDALLPREDNSEARLSFPAGPILVLGGPARAYVADAGDPAAFRERLLQLIPEPRLATFLQQAPTARTMLDTDGHQGRVFLDDLHELAHPEQLDPSLRPPHDLQPMCATLAWPGGDTTTISRHGPPPRALLPPRWQRHVDDLLHQGLVGLWGVRWHGDRVMGLLWVNDARWRGDPETSARLIDGRGDPRWDAARALARAEGLRAYPDAIEIREDDAWEVTVGLVDPGRADAGHHETNVR